MLRLLAGDDDGDEEALALQLGEDIRLLDLATEALERALERFALANLDLGHADSSLPGKALVCGVG